MERKRMRTDDSTVDIERREKVSRNDLICPICYELFKEVHVTSCGHSFCHDCIEQCLDQSPECPVCKQTVPETEQRFAPNFTLNDIVARIKADEKCDIPRVRSELRYILSLTDKLDSEELEQFQQQLESKKQTVQKSSTFLIELDNVSRPTYIKKMILIVGICRAVTLMTMTVLLLRLLALLLSNRLLVCLTMKEDEVVSQDVYIEFLRESQRRKTLENDTLVKQLEVLDKAIEEAEKSWEGDTTVGTSKRAHRMQQLHGNFEDIQNGYFSQVIPHNTMHTPFRNQLANITRYSTFKELSSLFYGDLPVTSGSSIVSSIEFDKDGDFFAVGGVTKKIKIYDYNMVSSQNPQFQTLHYPIIELPCQAKISSVCYNPYLKHQLAASDYDGALSVWDTHHNKCLHTFKEHEKRVWSVSYNTYDPGLIATGGDDCSLKLWHLTRSNNVRSRPTRANVCAVRFQPGNKYNLAYGSADHMVRLIDIRKFNEPYLVMKGHKKAVSYVQYLNDKELVSASTDSELKLWSTETGQCIKTFRGHINEKNFVGLTVNNDLIACGSENNSFCVYHKLVSQPLLKYKFDMSQSVLPGAQEPRDEGNDFVSSVCFRKDSKTILAANSQGYIKVLELS